MAFPATNLGLVVELALGADLTAAPSTWVWTDVTAYVYLRGQITITRGGFDGQAQSPPSRCTFEANNRDGRWCAYLPTGAWFGRIGRGTPIRVKTTEGSTSVRWTGFLAELPTRWDISENDVSVTVVAAGITRRLERGAPPPRSAMVRSIVGTTSPPVAYWPAEDGDGATSLAEFSGGPPMTWTGTLTLASDNPAGSNPLPELTQFVGLAGTVSYPNTNEWTVTESFDFPASPSGDTTILRWTTSGTYPMWQVVISPGSPDTLSLQAYDSTGTQQINDSTNFTTQWDPVPVEAFGIWFLLRVSAEQNGTGVDYALSFITGDGDSISMSGTEASITAGAVTGLSIPSSAKTNGMHAGHWAVWDYAHGAFGGGLYTAALSAHNGETVRFRVERLSAEAATAINGTVNDFLGESLVHVGPQPQSTYLNLLRECEAVDGGRLFEVRDPTSGDAFLGFLFSDDISNQAVGLALDHNSKHLNPPFEPTDDDQTLRNDWTATRSGASGIGSSARVVATGNLSPQKVGTYADSVSVNVETDEQLDDQAGWRVVIGTVEGLRFPQVTLDFARNPGLIASFITLDIGSRITISNPPPEIAPDTIDLLVEGWVETFGEKLWRVTLNCSPYAPWHTFQLAQTSGDTDPFLGRVAEDENCALHANATSGATTFLVDPNVTRWTTTADDFPLSIMAGGEKVTVSSIATTAGTFVGVGAANHTDNGPRNASLPSFSAGDLIVVVGAIRSSGVGTVNTPTGYTRLPIFAPGDNVGVFAKVAAASESSAAVTFNGGVAGDTCSAVAMTFSGTPTSLVDLADIVVDNVAQLNASAQNIAYGGLWPWKVEGCIQLFIAWKQDDYTSVTPPPGFTEMLEASTVVGNDQSLYIAYKIDTTPSVTPEGSLAVTGGAAAISRSAVTAIAAGYETFTLSARGVNGVTKAQTTGTKVATADPAVLAL